MNDGTGAGSGPAHRRGPGIQQVLRVQRSSEPPSERFSWSGPLASEQPPSERSDSSMHLSRFICSAPACLPGLSRAFWADERPAELNAQGGGSRSPEPDDGTKHRFPPRIGLTMALVASRGLFPPRRSVSPAAEVVPWRALRTAPPR